MSYYIPVFDIDFLTQFSVITALITLINIGIGFLSKANSDMKNYIDNLPSDERGHRRPPQNVEKLAAFNYKNYLNVLFACFVGLVSVYFFLLIFESVSEIV